MPNLDQTGSIGNDTERGRGQRSRTDAGQAASEQNSSLFGVLRRRFRAGRTEQGKGRGRGRGRGAGCCNRCGR